MNTFFPSKLGLLAAASGLALALTPAPAMADDLASPLPTPKVTLAPNVQTNTPSPSTEPSVAAPPADKTVGKRLDEMGFRSKEYSVELKERPPKIQTSGFLPALFTRDRWFNAFDAINPFGPAVTKAARPNSALLVGDEPPPAGLRNEISHEPVGMLVFGASR